MRTRLRIFPGCSPSVVLVAVVLGAIGYLLAWPLPVEPVSWNAPEAPPFRGAYARNSRLADVERFAEGIGRGLEDIAFDRQGRVHSGTADGRIVRLEPTHTGYKVLARTGGKPRGVALDPSGRLWVADAVRGLLQVTRDRPETVSREPVAGDPGTAGPVVARGEAAHHLDGIAVGPEGTLMLTSPGSPELSRAEGLLEQRGRGRLLSYDPDTHRMKVRARDLYFPSGVAVAPDGRSVLVAETARFRVRRLWLRGPKAGEWERFATNLPGFPEGISWDPGANVYWIALSHARNERLDWLMPHPFLRSIVLRIPAPLRPGARPYAFVLGLDRSGQVAYNLQDPAARYGSITSVTRHGPYLYLGSRHEQALARIGVPGS